MNSAELGAIIGTIILPGLGTAIGAANGATADAQGEAFRRHQTEHGSSADAAPKPVDYSETLSEISDNNSEIALAQIMSQEFSLRQTSVDRELQRSANLELSLEKFDTGLQTNRLEYIQAMTAAEHRHQEQLAQQHAQYSQLTGTEAGGSGDFPAPGWESASS